MAALCAFYGGYTLETLRDVTLAEFRTLVEVMEEGRGE